MEQPPVPTPTPELAGWGQRLGAYLIDGLVVSIPFTLAWFVYAFAIMMPRLIEASRRAAPGVPAPPPDPSLFQGLLGFYALVIVLSAAYYIWGNGRPSGQTLGKRAVHIAVRRDGGGELGYVRALVRWAVSIGLFFLFYIPGLVNYLWPLWDEKHQALHDKAAGSVVVRVP